MTADTDLVELTTAHSALEAEWWVGALKGHGIQAVVFGEELADEFAMSQKLMGLGGGIRVMVPRPTLDAAREAMVQIEEDRPSEAELEEAFAKTPALESDEAPPAQATASSPGKTAAIVLLTAGVVALGWFALKQQDTIHAFENQGLVFERTWFDDRYEARWRDGGALGHIGFDRDQTGDVEEFQEFDRSGRPFRTSLDANQNGVFETSYGLDAEGTRVFSMFDENENGIPERFEYAPRDGVIERWLDADENWHPERLQLLDAKTGDVLDTFEFRGRQGYVRVR